MGVILTKVKKPLRNWNLERRLERALEAPQKKEPLKRNIDPNSEVYRKDPQLIDRVKMANLKAHVEPTTDEVPNPETRMKLSREPVVEPEFGYYNVDPKSIPHGKTTLPRLLEMLAKIAPPAMTGVPPSQLKGTSAAEATSTSVERRTEFALSLTDERISALAQEYRLKPEQVYALVSRYRLFDLHVPNPKTPTVKRMQLLSESLRMGKTTSLQLEDEETVKKKSTTLPDPKKTPKTIAAGEADTSTAAAQR